MHFTNFLTVALGMMGTGLTTPVLGSTNLDRVIRGALGNKNYERSVEGAAAPTSDLPCIVPEVFFTSLPSPFSLSALTPGPANSTQQASWPVQLSPRDPSKTDTSIPVISRTKIAQPTFKLVNQTLFTANNFPADLLSTIAIFPPPLQPFDFGGPNAGDTAGKFGAVYSCDSTGQQIIKLVPDGERGFAVPFLAEGQQVYIKPNQFADKAVDVTLRVIVGVDEKP